MIRDNCKRHKKKYSYMALLLLSEFLCGLLPSHRHRLQPKALLHKLPHQLHRKLLN